MSCDTSFIDNGVWVHISTDEIWNSPGIKAWLRLNLPTTGFRMFSTDFLMVVNNYNKYCQQQYLFDKYCQQQYLSLQMTDVFFFSL